jgi:hypothetical protein
MKTIFTLVLASLFTVAAMAADRGPTVSIKNFTRYKVIIDGRMMRNDFDNFYEIRNMSFGRHTVTVVEARNGFFFGKRSRVISRTDFRVDGNDRRILINVGRFGDVHIMKDEFNDGRGKRGFNNWNRDDSRNNDGRYYDWNNAKDYDTHDRNKGNPKDNRNDREDDRAHNRPGRKN